MPNGAYIIERFRDLHARVATAEELTRQLSLVLNENQDQLRTLHTLTAQMNDPLPLHDMHTKLSDAQQLTLQLFATLAYTRDELRTLARLASQMDLPFLSPHDK